MVSHHTAGFDIDFFGVRVGFIFKQIFQFVYKLCSSMIICIFYNPENSVHLTQNDGHTGKI